MKVRNILLFYIETQYNVLNYKTERLYHEFIQLGYNVVIARTNEECFNLPKIKYDAIICFNGSVQEEHLLMLGLPTDILVYSIYVDDPIYHIERIEKRCKHQINAYCDRNHLKFIEEFMPESADFNTFLPTYGDYLNDVKPFNDRKYDIAFVGGYNDPDNIRSEIDAWGNENHKQEAYELIDYMWHHLDEPFYKVLNKRIVNIDKLSINDMKFIYDRFSIVDRYLRQLKRKTMLDYLVYNGFNVDIWGGGFKDYNNDKANLHRHPDVEFTEFINIMLDSKITLNVSPLFTDGAHERVSEAIGAGSLIMTDKSKYLSEVFENFSDIIFYDFDHLDDLGERLEYLLSNSTDSQIVIDNLRPIIKNNYTFRDMAGRIIADIESTY